MSKRCSLRSIYVACLSCVCGDDVFVAVLYGDNEFGAILIWDDAYGAGLYLSRWVMSFAVCVCGEEGKHISSNFLRNLFCEYKGRENAARMRTFRIHDNILYILALSVPSFVTVCEKHSVDKGLIHLTFCRETFTFRCTCTVYIYFLYKPCLLHTIHIIRYSSYMYYLMWISTSIWYVLIDDSPPIMITSHMIHVIETL